MKKIDYENTRIITQPDIFFAFLHLMNTLVIIKTLM